MVERPVTRPGLCGYMQVRPVRARLGTAVRLLQLAGGQAGLDLPLEDQRTPTSTGSIAMVRPANSRA